MRKLNKEKTTLFISLSCHPSGFAFYIWNKPDQVFMAFQVAIKESLPSHSDDLWMNLCCDELKESEIQVYWIVPDNFIGNLNDFKDSVILFSDLYKEFPALNKLIL